VSLHRTAVGPAAPSWWTRENVAAGVPLLVVTALAWVYTLHVASMSGMAGMAAMDGGGASGPGQGLIQTADALLFLFGWAVMMIAMMLPAALPLVLLYRAIARKRGSPPQVVGVAALLAGYVAVWTVAGLPVYGYGQFMASGGPALAVLPGLLLIMGGLYQFTALKRGCHTRCSSPLFFLTHHWRPDLPGAARLGVLHGLDCLGCCMGLMLALVALGMMNVAWMLTAAVIIFVEKTLPGGHRVARPLGVVLVVGGVVVLGASLLSM
jgi:predicted metal-binding membrane protein